MPTPTRSTRFLDGFISLGRKINKTSGEFEEEREEGVIGEPVSEITLQKPDKELVILKNKWEKKWNESKVRKDVERKQKDNERYWKGQHHTPAQRRSRVHRRQAVDNLIFEALETFLPVATKQIAQPVIDTVEQEEAQEFSKRLADRIVHVSDVIRLRLKMKKAVRNWALYYLGVLKFGWSLEKNEISVQAVRPQQLVLDPDAITEECEYEGEYIGHFRTDTAADLIDRFPKKEKFIKNAIGKEHLGTTIRYVEWWTNEMVFWTLKDEVLDKSRNPHWNYDQEVEDVDEFGDPITRMEEATNHFSQPKVPFAMLSIFNLGTGPVDDTNQIEQVLPLQDIVNKRTRQEDRNADNTNGGVVVSGDHFTSEQASGVANALRRGNAVRVPTGDINRAFRRDQGPPLPQFVHQSLVESRERILGIFGVTGLSTEGLKGEDTVRGKILAKGADTDRSALIVDHIEQYYDYVFNWFVQLMMVYYEAPENASDAQGVDILTSDEFVWPLVVSVKEGSLIPKDRLTQRNEAVDLWGAGAIDPLTLAERLEEADPKEFVRRLILWKMSPVSLLQEGDQFQQQEAQPEEGGLQTAQPQVAPEQETLGQIPL